MGASETLESPPAEPALEPTIATEFPVDRSDAWPDIEDANREYLLGPPIDDPPTIEQLTKRGEWEHNRHPGPCPFCGGRARHDALCVELRKSWIPEMPWGKHKGERLSEVPRVYLKWILRKVDLQSDLRTDIERVIE